MMNAPAQEATMYLLQASAEKDQHGEDAGIMTGTDVG